MAQQSDSDEPLTFSRPSSASDLETLDEYRLIRSPYPDTNVKDRKQRQDSSEIPQTTSEILKIKQKVSEFMESSFIFDPSSPNCVNKVSPLFALDPTRDIHLVEEYSVLQWTVKSPRSDLEFDPCQMACTVQVEGMEEGHWYALSNRDCRWAGTQRDRFFPVDARADQFTKIVAYKARRIKSPEKITGSTSDMSELVKTLGHFYVSEASFGVLMRKTFKSNNTELASQSVLGRVAPSVSAPGTIQQRIIENPSCDIQITAVYPLDMKLKPTFELLEGEGNLQADYRSHVEAALQTEIQGLYVQEISMWHGEISMCESPEKFLVPFSTDTEILITINRSISHKIAKYRILQTNLGRKLTRTGQCFPFWRKSVLKSREEAARYAVRVISELEDILSSQGGGLCMFAFIQVLQSRLFAMSRKCGCHPKKDRGLYNIELGKFLGELIVLVGRFRNVNFEDMDFGTVSARLNRKYNGYIPLKNSDEETIL